MELAGTPKINLNEDAKRFINLYSSLGERAENFLPDHVFESLKNFARLCCEEADDPNRLNLEISKRLLELKEAIPGYIDVSLMILCRHVNFWTSVSLFNHLQSRLSNHRTQGSTYNSLKMSTSLL